MGKALRTQGLWNATRCIEALRSAGLKDCPPPIRIPSEAEARKQAAEEDKKQAEAKKKAQEESEKDENEHDQISQAKGEGK